MANVESKTSKSNDRPKTLRELRHSGWCSKTVKREIYDNFMRMLARQEDLFPGIIGYEDTVVPEINLGLIAQHDMLFLGEKGQGKSRLMRLLTRFLDEEVPYLDIPGSPVHEDPYAPITTMGRRLVARNARHGNAHRLVAARRALRRAAGAGHEVRRHHRRDRPCQAGRRHEHVGRRGIALRAHPADAPRHLRRQRTAGTGRTGASRPVQHPRRARRADSRLPDPLRYRRADPLLGQPGDVQPQRQSHPAAQGPHRLGDPHALSQASGSWASRSWSRSRRSIWAASFPSWCRTSCARSSRR